MDSDKPAACIISPDRFQTELLAVFLLTEIELRCTIFSPFEIQSHNPGPSGPPGTKSKHPSIVLWDCDGKNPGDAPDRSWSAMVERMNAMWQNPHIALYNVKKDRRNEFRAVRSGIRGVFFRDTESGLLARGIRAIMAGELWYSRECLASYLEDSFRGDGAGPSGGLPLPEDLLTRREADILRKMASGCSSARIAEDFSISPHTVKTHIRNIYKKIGAKNRFEAIRWLSHNG